MARITHVKAARQRYEMVPVLDAFGQPKRTPVMRDGVQATNKRGEPTFRAVTEPDLAKPLDPEECGKCGKPIEVGDPYKWIAPKSGPYGGTRLVRCASCPDWRRWEYNNSVGARLEGIVYDCEQALADVTGPDDVQSVVSEAADAIREIADEKRDGAQNIEDGFGHPTEQSEEMTDLADQLEQWADEGDSLDIDDPPEPEPEQCEECDGQGETEVECGACKGSGTDENDDGLECGGCEGDGTVARHCEECDGTGEVTPDEPTEDQVEEWRSDAEGVVTDWLGNNPL